LDLGMLRKDRGCPVLLGCKTAGTGRPRNSHLQQNGNGFRGLEWMNMAWGGGLRMGGSETASTGECGHQSPVLPSPWGVTRRNEPKTMVAVTGGGGEIPANTCWLVEWTFQLGLTRVRQKRWGGGKFAVRSASSEVSDGGLGRVWRREPRHSDVSAEDNHQVG
jgi:hypothetical protein